CRELIEGVNAEDVVFSAVAESAPGRLLEVGCGAGEMAARIGRELGAEVVGLDQSARMVDLTRERGVEAVVGDVQALPFDDGDFDCVVAGWLFYHVADRELAIAECARVLRPGGRLVAATLADENLADRWVFLGSPRERSRSSRRSPSCGRGTCWRSVVGGASSPSGSRAIPVPRLPPSTCRREWSRSRASAASMRRSQTSKRCRSAMMRSTSPSLRGCSTTC